MGALEMLHFREQMAEMLGVPAVAPAAVLPGGGRAGQHGLGEAGIDPGGPGVRIDGEIAGEGIEHLRGVGEQAIEGGLGAAVAFRGAVAEADEPFGAVPEVGAAVLFGRGGDIGQGRVGGAEGAPVGVDIAAVEEQPGDGAGEVAIGLFEQQEIAELAFVAQKSELVLGVAGGGAGQGVEAPRLTDQVECDVGERQVFLEHRGMAAPFAEAVPEDQGIIGTGEGEAHERGCGNGDADGGCHHM